MLPGATVLCEWWPIQYQILLEAVGCILQHFCSIGNIKRQNKHAAIKKWVQKLVSKKYFTTKEQTTVTY
jgi:hypothetical protein